MILKTLRHFGVAALCLTGCGPTEASQRPYPQYPPLELVTRDTRYPASLGVVNTPGYLLTTLERTELQNPNTLLGQRSLVYDKARREVVMTFTDRSYLYSSLTFGDTIVTLLDGELVRINPRTKTRTPLPSDFLSKPLSDSLLSQSVIVGDQAYLVLTNKILVYSVDALANDAAPRPRWFLEREFDTVSIDADSGELAYAYRSAATVPDRLVNAFVVRLKADGTTRASFQVLSDVFVAYGFLSVALDRDALYTLGGGKMILSKYNAQNRLDWQTAGFLCRNNGTPTPRRLLRYGDTLLALPNGDDCFSAWDRAEGKLRWVFQPPNGLTFGNTPLLLRGVLYTANGLLWALDFDTGKVLAASDYNRFTQNDTGTPVYDAGRNQIILWGKELQTYSPLR